MIIDGIAFELFKDKFVFDFYIFVFIEEGVKRFIIVRDLESVFEI
jgi:hypothetical protein